MFAGSGACRTARSAAPGRAEPPGLRGGWVQNHRVCGVGACRTTRTARGARGRGGGTQLVRAWRSTSTSRSSAPARATRSSRRSCDDKHIAIIEGGTFGGTCLNVGCIPTKMFVYPADVAATPPRRAAPLGVDAHARPGALAGHPRPDLRADRPDLRRRRATTATTGAATSPLYDGHAQFTGPRRSASTADGPARTLTADQFVLAAGSRAGHARPRRRAVRRAVPHLRHDHAASTSCPSGWSILGGGYIAAEFAHVFCVVRRAGHPVVARSAGCCAHLDDDIAERLHRPRPRPLGPAHRAPTVASVAPATAASVAHRPRRRHRRSRPTCCSSPPGAPRTATGSTSPPAGVDARRRRPDRGRRVPAHDRRRASARSATSLAVPAQARRQPRGAGRRAQPAAPRRPARSRPPLRARRRCSPIRRSPRVGLHRGAGRAQRPALRRPRCRRTAAPPTAGRWRTPPASARCSPTPAPACCSAPTSWARRPRP